VADHSVDRARDQPAEHDHDRGRKKQPGIPAHDRGHQSTRDSDDTATSVGAGGRARISVNTSADGQTYAILGETDCLPTRQPASVTSRLGRDVAVDDRATLRFVIEALLASLRFARSAVPLQGRGDVGAVSGCQTLVRTPPLTAL
jgi:hypothetical protein